MERQEVRMTEDEFDVLDELYFVISFTDLLGSVDLNREELIDVLQSLLQKEWIRVLHSPEEPVFQEVDLSGSAEAYFYLASKKGLLEHNSNQS